MLVSSVAGVLLAAPTTPVLARIGLRLTGVVALAFTEAGTALRAVADSATTILVGRTIEGVAVSVTAMLAPMSISLWLPPKGRGLPMGIRAACVPLGNVIMFNAAQPWVDTLGWRAVWWLGLASGDGGRTGGTRSQEALDPPASLGRILSNRSTWLMTLAFAAFGFSVIGCNTWAPLLPGETLQMGAAEANTTASLMTLAAIPADVLAGWSLSRIKDRPAFLPVTFLLTAILFLWSFNLGSAGGTAVYMVTLGLGSNFEPTAMFTLALETMPDVRYAALALAMVMGGSYLGSLLGPPALGVLLSAGRWRLGCACLVIMTGIGTAAL